MPSPAKAGQAGTLRSHIEEFFNNLRVVLVAPKRPHLPFAAEPLDAPFIEVGPGRVPGRGLLYSFLVHEFFLTALLLIPARVIPERHFRDDGRWRPVDSKLAYLLPAVGGSHTGSGSARGKPAPKAQIEAARAPTAGGPPGAAYPGPQTIVSNPPNPTGGHQTLLQPDLANPAILKFPLPLPNMVLMMRASLPPSPELKPAQLSRLLPPPELLKALSLEPTPKLPFTIPSLPPPPDGSVPHLESPPTTPEHPELDQAPSSGADAQSLLALSLFPLPPESKFELPLGELHGQFTIGPEGVLDAGQNGAGPSGTPNSAAGETTGETGGEDRTGPAGVGPAQGSYPGAGASSGSGTGKWSLGGNGAGSGAGTGGFPGISITGGSGDSGIASGQGSTPGSQPTSNPHPYDLTISSTASSGGGLRDYGVFRNESVYTVYIDMSRPDHAVPSWILQYAPQAQPPPKPPDRVWNVDLSMSGPQSQVVPPFPIYRPIPDFSEQVLAQNLGRMVVVYGVISPAGKLEEMRIIQSPDEALSEAALEGLGRWTFRPAEENGAPIAVKVLLGIPLFLPL